MAVDEDAPEGDVEEARNQIHERRLAGSAGTDQRQHFAGLDAQIYVVQNLVLAFLGGVGEAHILKSDGILEALEHDGVRPLLHVVLGVEEAEDGGGCAHGLLEAVVEVGELAHRIVKLEQRQDEGGEDADGHAPVLDLIAADVEKHGDGDGADRVHQRRADGLNADAAQVGAKQPCSRPLEAKDFPNFCIEGLDDAIAGHRFMQDVLNFRQLVLPGAGAGAHIAANLARRNHHHGNKQEERQAEMAAVVDHHRQAAQEGEELLQELADHRADRVLHPVHVVDERGKDGSSGVLVKEAGGAAQRGLVEVVAQIGDHAEAGVVHQIGARVIANPLEQRGGDQRKGHHRPVVVQVQVGEDHGLHAAVPGGFAADGSERVACRAGMQHIVEDGHKQQ